MPKKIVFEPATEIKVTGIIGFLKRKVTAYGTGAKVTCPKEYLGKTVYLVIVNEPDRRKRTAMSEHVDGIHRKQTILFPDTLDEYVDEENPVRFIDAFIDSLRPGETRLQTLYPMRNRKTLLRSFRPAQALRVRLPKPGKVQQKTRERMPPQP